MLRRGTIAATIAMIGVMTTMACGQDSKADPAQASVARFIDDSTFAVIRIDAEKFKLDVLAKPAEAIMPNGNERSALVAGKMMVAGWLEQFRRAGGQELLILGPFDLDVQELAVVVLTTEKADIGALKSVLMQLAVGGPLAGTRPVEVPGGLAMGGQNSVRRLLERKESTRKLSIEPFGSQKDAGIQLFVIPNEDQRKVINQFLPGGLNDPSVAAAWKGDLEWITAGISTNGELSAKLEIGTKDQESAAGLHKWLGALWKSLRNAKETQEMIAQVDAIAGTLEPKVSGNRVQLVVDAKFIDGLTPVLAEFAKRAKAEADQARAIHALKFCSLAMHNYHDQKKTFPPAVFRDKEGKPLLSWRVHVLPYIEQAPLYSQFHLDEPWDSDHNKKLIPLIPEILASQNPKLRAEGKTPFVVPTGETTVFGLKEGTRIGDILDGTSNTLLILEVDDAHSVVWTKPDDLPIEGAKLKEIVRAFALADGSVRRSTADFTEAVLQQLATRAGKEPIQWPGQ